MTINITPCCVTNLSSTVLSIVIPSALKLSQLIALVLLFLLMDSFEAESDAASSLNTAESHDARSILSYIRGTAAVRGASIADQIAAIQPEQLLVAEPQ